MTKKGGVVFRDDATHPCAAFLPPVPMVSRPPRMSQARVRIYQRFTTPASEVIPREKAALRTGKRLALGNKSPRGEIRTMFRFLAPVLAALIVLGRPVRAEPPGTAQPLGYTVTETGLFGVLSDPALLSQATEGIYYGFSLITAYPVVHDRYGMSMGAILPIHPHPLGILVAGRDDGLFCAATGVIHAGGSFVLGGRLGVVVEAPEIEAVRPYGALLGTYRAGRWSFTAGYDGSMELRAAYATECLYLGGAWRGEAWANTEELAVGAEYRPGPYALRAGLVNLSGLWYYTAGVGYRKGDWQLDLSWRQEMITPELQHPAFRLALGNWH